MGQRSKNDGLGQQARTEGEGQSCKEPTVGLWPASSDLSLTIAIDDVENQQQRHGTNLLVSSVDRLGAVYARFIFASSFWNRGC